MAQNERSGSRRGNQRISRTLETGRPGGDRRKFRASNNSTTQDDLSPAFFEIDREGQVCIKMGEGLTSSATRGLEVRTGSGLMKKGGEIVVRPAGHVTEIDGATSDTDLKLNELIGMLRSGGFLARRG